MAAIPAQAAPPVVRAAPCADASRPSPMAVTLSGVHGAYRAGGGWTTLRLTVRNRTGAVCAQVRPVLVYGARGRTLRANALRLESLRGGHWHRVDLDPALGQLAGRVGPSAGLRLRAGESATLQVRMRVTRAAPHGEWLSLAVAYAPMQSKGTTVSWPVGVTNPSYFRVTG
ncbi:hypothetical protein [Streptacidiphilus rugosus]|uniref:hypothetical protein n=1 Tax=Streptacidiphilus rugosus TaxID=405783 RepID=UPI0012F82C0F|nr:hypothetical protein [Streptacidiphilus rugosus]